MGSLEVEAPDEQTARALIEALEGLHAEVEPDGRIIRMALGSDRGAEAAVVLALDAVDRWLVAHKIPAATVRLDGRPYTMTANGGRATPPSRTQHE
jgi:hypothetical protein